MQNKEFKAGDRVVVSAKAFGFGEDQRGVVSGVTNFAKHSVVSVTLDKTSPNGRRICLTLPNPGLLMHEKETQRFPEATLPDDQQVRETCEIIPKLQHFAVIGKYPKGANSDYFASVNFDDPIELSKAVFQLLVGAPSLANPIAMAVDMFWKVRTPDK